MAHLFLEIVLVDWSKDWFLNSFEGLYFLTASENWFWALSSIFSWVWKCVVVLKEQNLVLASDAAFSSDVFEPLLFVSVFVWSGFIGWSLHICSWLWVKRMLIITWMLHSLKHKYSRMIEGLFVIRRKLILFFNFSWKVKSFVQEFLYVNWIMSLIESKFNARRGVFFLVFRLCFNSHFVSRRDTLATMRHFVRTILNLSV